MSTNEQARYTAADVLAMADEIADFRRRPKTDVTLAPRIELMLRGIAEQAPAVAGLVDDAKRAVAAWDQTVLPRIADGMLQERMECLRDSTARLRRREGMSQYTPEQVEGIAANIGTQEIVAVHMLRAYAATLRQQAARVDVDGLAQEIRRVDGSHSMGAGALAEALIPYLTAALAQNTQGEDAGLYVEARQCEDCDHLGINDSSGTVSACGDCDWQGRTPDEDKCPGCGHENCMAVACPICGGRYRFLADRRFYLHAERARVPEDDELLEIARRVGLRSTMHAVSASDAKPLLRLFVQHVLAAAPSQPEDAGEVES